ncbi:hypothetical protein ACSBR2_022542 [Camellia fascicularis]
MKEDRGRPLPKFGEWDVNNPASADGFTVIFAKARDDKKTNGNAANGAQSAQKNDNNPPRPDLNSQLQFFGAMFVSRSRKDEVVILLV